MALVHSRIVGYHWDADGHWIAELSCGHARHIRHEPPWTVSAWVTTAAGRAARVGTLLACGECSAP
ncbi:MAG: DUF3565 domain-containing protein [Gemmatimonadales bacterium]